MADRAKKGGEMTKAEFIAQISTIDIENIEKFSIMVEGDGKLSRSTYAFSSYELLGFLTYIQQDLIMQMTSAVPCAQKVIRQRIVDSLPEEDKHE
jgi:hypothetical protein